MRSTVVAANPRAPNSSQAAARMRLRVPEAGAGGGLRGIVG